MLKRELKVNLKGFMIWTAVLILTFLLVFVMYPFLIDGEQMEQINELLKIFPEEVLKAFNMDISSLETAYGWLKTEGYIFILLIAGCFAGVTGSNIVLKEEADKTIEYLVSLPISRKQVVKDKVVAGLIYTVGMIIVLGIFNYIGLKISGDFNEKEYILLALAPILPCVVFFSGCLFISTFFHKTKYMLGISLGSVFLSYILQIISEISDKVSFLKYFTPFTLADTRGIIGNGSISIGCIVVGVILTIALLASSFYRYSRKDLLN